MDRQNLLLAAFVLVFLIFLAYLLFFSPSAASANGNSAGRTNPGLQAGAPAPKSQCTDGDTLQCTTEKGCQGYMICRNGAFGGCLTNQQVCRPGTRTWCTENGCSQGYRYCNDCGSGYGPCVLPNATATEANAMHGNVSAS